MLGGGQKDHLFRPTQLQLSSTSGPLQLLHIWLGPLLGFFMELSAFRLSSVVTSSGTPFLVVF